MEGTPGSEGDAAVWQSFGLLSAALDATGAAVAVTDTMNALRYANSAFARCADTPDSVLTGAAVDDLCADSAVARLLRDDRTVLCTLRAIAQDVPISVDGAVRWVRLQKDPILSFGRCIGVVTIAHDLPDHFSNEQDTHKVALVLHNTAEHPEPDIETRYRLLAENATDVIVTYGADGNCTFVSPACRRVFGRDPDTLIGLGPDAFCHPDDAGSLRLTQTRLKQPDAGGHRRMRYRIQKGGGDYVWIEATFRADRDPATGHVKGMVAVSRDVGDQMLESEWMRRSRLLYKGLFDESSAPMLLIDPDDGRILQANAAAGRFYGYGIAQIRHLTIQALSTLTTDQARDTRKDAASRRQNVFEERHRLASGEVRDVQIHSTPMVMEGNTVLFCIVHDITDNKIAEVALKRSHANLEAFFTLSRDFLTVLEPNGRILAANPTVAERLGWPREALVGQPFTALHPPNHRGAIQSMLRKALTGNTAPLNAPMLSRQGDLIPTEIRLVPGTWNTAPALFCASRDLSDLALSEEKFQKAFMHNATLMAITEPDTGRFVDINTAFMRALARDQNGVILKTLAEIGVLPDPDRATLGAPPGGPPGDPGGMESDRNILDSAGPSELRFTTNDGTTFAGEISAQRIGHGVHEYLLVMVSDVTNQRALMEELEHKATHDLLTGAFNRVVTDRILEHETHRANRTGTPVSLIIADIDHFKAINDRYGHPVGDAVLKDVVQRLSERIRETDLLARWGGEEFLVILPGTGASGALQLAETLRTAISEAPFPTVGTVTISVGVAPFHRNETVQDWIARTDRALYMAKEGGRDQVKASLPPPFTSGAPPLALVPPTAHQALPPPAEAGE